MIEDENAEARLELTKLVDELMEMVQLEYGGHRNGHEERRAKWGLTKDENNG